MYFCDFVDETCIWHYYKILILESARMMSLFTQILLLMHVHMCKKLLTSTLANLSVKIGHHEKIYLLIYEI